MAAIEVSSFDPFYAPDCPAPKPIVTHTKLEITPEAATGGESA